MAACRCSKVSFAFGRRGGAANSFNSMLGVLSLFNKLESSQDMRTIDQKIRQMNVPVKPKGKRITSDNVDARAAVQGEFGHLSRSNNGTARSNKLRYMCQQPAAPVSVPNASQKLKTRSSTTLLTRRRVDARRTDTVS